MLAQVGTVDAAEAKQVGGYLWTGEGNAVVIHGLEFAIKGHPHRVAAQIQGDVAETAANAVVAYLVAYLEFPGLLNC